LVVAYCVTLFRIIDITSFDNEWKKYNKLQLSVYNIVLMIKKVTQVKNENFKDNGKKSALNSRYNFLKNIL